MPTPPPVAGSVPNGRRGVVVDVVDASSAAERLGHDDVGGGHGLGAAAAAHRLAGEHTSVEVPPELVSVTVAVYVPAAA